MRKARLELDCSRVVGELDMSRMGLGQGGLSRERMWETRVAEVRALRPKLIRFWIQEYFDVMPREGEYRFEGIDASIEMVLATGATPLVSLNMKPKVLFPEINERNMAPTNWEKWEELVYRLVERYASRGLKGWYWEIGGETDQGEGGGCPYLADAETYQPFYEHTVRAILRADQSARVGGAGFCHLEAPFMGAWLDACLKGAIPVHFVSWHIYSNDPLQIAGTVRGVRGLLAERPGLQCETILDEWNMSLGYLSGHTADPRFQPCFVAETVYQMLDAGLDYSCYYHIRDYHVDIDAFRPFFTEKGAAFMARWWNRMPQADGLFDYQDVVRPAYFAFKLLSRMTGERLQVVSNDDKVHAIFIHDRQFQLRNVLFWNFADSPVEVEVVLKGLGGKSELLEYVLDAAGPRDDENHRIRPVRKVALGDEVYEAMVGMEPFGVQFWCVHGRSWDLGA